MMKNIICILIPITVLFSSCEEKIISENLRVEYPSTGKYGENFLDTAKTVYTMDQFSMIAILPEGASLQVIVDGSNFGVSTSQFFQDIGWRYDRPEGDYHANAIVFNSTRSGTIDLEMDLEVAVNPSDQLMVYVYENQDTAVTWSKTITIDREGLILPF